MTGGTRIELAEALDVIEADGGVSDDLVVGVDRAHAGEEEQRVEQHRGVPSGEHEAVAVGPNWIGRIKAQKALPERVGNWCHRHRRPGMTGASPLDRVNRQRANRVDAELVDVPLVRLHAHCGDPIPQHIDCRGSGGRRGSDTEKRLAAEAAAELVEEGMAVGLGTGSTVAHLLPALARRGLRGIRCVATSVATEVQARELGIAVEEFGELERLDIAIDGADQVAADGWLIKGGGGAHLRELSVPFCREVNKRSTAGPSQVDRRSGRKPARTRGRLEADSTVAGRVAFCSPCADPAGAGCRPACISPKRSPDISRVLVVPGIPSAMRGQTLDPPVDTSRSLTGSFTRTAGHRNQSNRFGATPASASPSRTIRPMRHRAGHDRDAASAICPARLETAGLPCTQRTSPTESNAREADARLPQLHGRGRCRIRNVAGRRFTGRLLEPT